MVYKLKPLEFSFDFEDREYSLGETVDVPQDSEIAEDVRVPVLVHDWVPKSTLFKKKT